MYSYVYNLIQIYSMHIDICICMYAYRYMYIPIRLPLNAFRMPSKGLNEGIRIPKGLLEGLVITAVCVSTAKKTTVRKTPISMVFKVIFILLFYYSIILIFFYSSRFC
jgi:hypothetical protein